MRRVRLSSVVRLAVLLVLSAAIALVMAGTSAAATFRVGVSGTSVQTVSGDPGPSTIQLDVLSDPGGANPSGTIKLDTYTNSSVSSLATFHGDYANQPGAGCVLTQGNQTVAIAPLPQSEWVAVGSRTIKFAVAAVEDNGPTGDRASDGLLFDTTAVNWCSGGTSFSSMVSFLVPVDSGNYSASYADKLDGFPGLADATVRVVDTAGLPVSVTDAPDPDGLDVSAGAGTGTVKLDTCANHYEVDVTAGTDALINCGSVILHVVHGSADVVLGDGITTVTVTTGGKAEVAGDEASGFTVDNLGSTAIGVTVDGVQDTIAPGETAPVEAWVFQGFSGPVANTPTVNTVMDGSAVPFKWRLLDSTGAPVADLSAATLTFTGRDCSTGTPVGPTHPAALVGSGLQNLGNGYYQLNWKTPAASAGTCQTTHLDIGDGVTHDAVFKLK